ncbi:peptide ABC transporter substrate-binding protein [Woeseia oceani]|uniref:peptide ABC transporter substrate-binding protein n=1 Tax=Woeseia oceani TaxID=1548547 RepID=UPI0009F59283|nr:peptide ABC transporter substrate-binding protein [Woeseia oceani]
MEGKHRKLSSWFLTAVAVLVVPLLFACSGPVDNGGTLLNRGVGPEPESLDPHHTRTTQAHRVQRDLFEGLVGYSADGVLIPAAAERWEVSDDGKRYTFWIRDTARWSNGDPVTADDFVYSFRRLVNPETAAFYGELMIAVKNAPAIIEKKLNADSLGVTALGPKQLQITLDYPVPYFIGQLALVSAYPVHAANIAEHGDSFARAGKLISNGAYQLKNWELGSFIELTRNPHYWNNAATQIDRVRHHVTVEASAELYRYRAGELDITAVVPSEAYAQLAKDRPDELRVAPFLGTYFYGFNLMQEKLRDNPKLREALSMAIDRDVLTEKVTARGEQPAWSWVPPGIANYAPQRFSYADLPRAERHAAARRLYQEAGYGADKPLQIEIRYNTAETHERLALAIQSMWQDVLGFEATLINEEFRVLISNIREMRITELFRLSWNGDYNDAHSFLSIFESGNASNLTGYQNPRFDELMQAAAQQVDPQLRRQYLEQAEREMLDDHPVIPLYIHVSKHLVSPRVQGWQDNVLDFHYSQHLSLRDSNDPE